VSAPTKFMRSSLTTAELAVVDPPEPETPPIKLQFNPSDYKIKKDNVFAELPTPGIEAPVMQYSHGTARVLTVAVLADTTDDPSLSVQELRVAPIERLLKQADKLHAPPLVKFSWADASFTGVLQSLETEYQLFGTDGKPLRAKMTLIIKEATGVERLKADAAKGSSPDVEKRYVVRAGETLSSISAGLFRDPSHWREIAVANAIADPRDVAPGTVLTVPRLAARRA
jgi:nucleoid-associated protein YgaU